MHTVRHDGGQYAVVFVQHQGAATIIGIYKNVEDAFGICSYLNGGLPPAGYIMAIKNVGN